MNKSSLHKQLKQLTFEKITIFLLPPPWIAVFAVASSS